MMMMIRPLLSSILYKKKNINNFFVVVGATPPLFTVARRRNFFSTTTSTTTNDDNDKENNKKKKTNNNNNNNKTRSYYDHNNKSIFDNNNNNNSSHRLRRQKKSNFTTTTTTPPTTTTTSSTLPIIEITSLINENENESNNNKDKDKEELLRIGIELDSAFRKHGFAYLSYTDDVIPYDFIEQVLQVSHDFFDLPQEEKELLSISIIDQQQQQEQEQDHHHYVIAPVRGYQKIGDNITLGKPDYHEAIDFIRDCPPPTTNKDDDDDDDHHHHHPLAGINKWPKRPSEFEYILQKYIQTMLKLGNHIMKSIAIANNSIPDEEFESKFNDPFWIMRVIRYPQQQSYSVTNNEKQQQQQQQQQLDHDDDDDNNSNNNNNNSNMGCGEHTDYGCLTFVLADDIPSENCLQVYDQSTKNWINAPSISNTFIINCGDMLSHWSCGQYISTPHRVLSPTKTTCSSRISVPFFFEPNFNSIIKPLPKYFLINNDDEDNNNNNIDIDDSSSSSSSSIKFGDHVTHRLLSNFRYSPDIDKNLER